MIKHIVFFVVLISQSSLADLFKNPILKSKLIYLERIPVGQVAPYTSRSLYNIKIENQEGHRIGQITVYASFHNYEDGVSDLTQPSGPANRKIVHDLTGYSINHAWVTTATETEKKQLDMVVENLKETSGSHNSSVVGKSAADTNKAKLDLRTEEFKESFKRDMKSQYQWTVKFE